MAEEARMPKQLSAPSGKQTPILLPKSQAEIIAESKKGLSSNVNRPDGTLLRNNQNSTPATNSQ